MTIRRRAVRTARIAAITLVASALLAGPALAAWNATSTGASGTSKATSLPAATAPTLTRLGRDAKVTWSQVTFGGQLLGSYANGGYVVQRGGSTAGGGCSGIQTPGSTVNPSCTEAGLSPGSYSYGIVTSLSNWKGSASPTTAITVPSPSLVFSPATWTSPSTPLHGSLDAFLDNAALTYRLDNATTGPVLSATLNTFPTAPAAPAATDVSVGCASATGSAHTVYATSGTDSAAGAFTFSFGTILCPASLATGIAGTTPGMAQLNDSIAIVFSRAVNPGTICSGLVAGGSTSNRGNLLVTIVDGGGGVNDTMQVTAPAGPRGVCGATGSTAGTVHIGTINLGSPNYATGGNVTFNGTTNPTSSDLSLDAAGVTLTITLGAQGGATAGTAAVGSIATYTADPTITSLTGSLFAQGYMTSADRLF